MKAVSQKPLDRQYGLTFQLVLLGVSIDWQGVTGVAFYRTKNGKNFDELAEIHLIVGTVKKSQKKNKNLIRKTSKTRPRN
jgi:hypothetical protein